jgi:hypothetical protein
LAALGSAWQRLAALGSAWQILDTQEYVDSENIKLKIGYGSSLYQIFQNVIFNSQNVAEIGKNLQNIFLKVSFFTLFVLRMFPKNVFHGL